MPAGADCERTGQAWLIRGSGAVAGAPPSSGTLRWTVWKVSGEPVGRLAWH